MVRTIVAVSLSCALLALGLAACQEKTTILSSSPAAPSQAAGTPVTSSGSGTLMSTTGPSQAGVRIAGTITSVDATSGTIVVHQTTITIPSSTVIRRGATDLAFADLQAGQGVEVLGTLSGSTLVATQIEVFFEPGQNPTHASGVIADLAGKCPALTFTLGSVKVATAAMTIFVGSPCSALANGANVRTEGIAQADGSIAASRVESPAKGSEP
jgi:hypothetical protein